jgi:NitT/TauT family transport system permease protein
MTALQQRVRPVGPVGPVRAWRGRGRDHQRFIPGGNLWWLRVTSVVLALGTWEAVGQQMNPLFLPPPSRVVSAMADSFSADLLPAIWSSLGTFALGYSLSAVLGIPIGMAMGRSRVVEHTLDTFVYSLYVVPTVAFVPLLVLWLGFGLTSKLIIVISVAIFPIIINCYVGARDVSASYVEVGRASVASRRKVFFSIVVPATLPFILAGLRLSIARALTGMVVAELFTAIGGLGGLLMIYSNQLRTDRAFGPVIVLMTMGIGFTALLRFAETRVVAWKETERAQR